MFVWIGIIFDGGEEGMGIEEKRVAHGTEWFSTPIKERNEGWGDADMLIAPYDWEPCHGKIKNCMYNCIYLEDTFSE